MQHQQHLKIPCERKTLFLLILTCAVQGFSTLSNFLYLWIIKELRFKKKKNPCIFKSIRLFHPCQRVGSQWQQATLVIPDLALASRAFQLLLEDPRPDGTHYPSSESWAYPWASAQLVVPGTPLRRGVLEACTSYAWNYLNCPPLRRQRAVTVPVAGNRGLSSSTHLKFNQTPGELYLDGLYLWMSVYFQKKKKSQMEYVLDM